MINNASKQFKYSTDADIILTYSNYNQKMGICGHLFEVIDYWEILRNNFKVEILIGEDKSEDEINNALTKYKDDIVDDIKSAIKFIRPRVYDAKNTILIFTDGNLDTNLIYNVKKIILFPCGKRDYTYLETFKNKQNILIMHDTRLKYIIPESINSKHYVKKINFNILKSIDKQYFDNFIYATSSCRIINNSIINKHLNKSKLENKKLYVLINNGSPLLDNKILDDDLVYEILPVKDIFSRFSKFIYTGILRKWDCSNRLLAECKFYNIDTIIDEEINEDYLSEDLGLKYRMHDINHAFEDLFLRYDDKILDEL